MAITNPSFWRCPWSIQLDVRMPCSSMLEYCWMMSLVISKQRRRDGHPVPRPLVSHLHAVGVFGAQFIARADVAAVAVVDERGHRAAAGAVDTPAVARNNSSLCAVWTS